MRIQRSADDRDIFKPRPDMIVRCGAMSNRHYVTDPLVIVEVLSPTTMDTDRGDKLRLYKSLPMLRHVVFAYQDDIRIEHYQRTDAGWEIETLTRPADRLALEAVGFEISLERIHFGVLFDD